MQIVNQSPVLQTLSLHANTHPLEHYEFIVASGAVTPFGNNN